MTRGYLSCERVQAKLFARHHALCVLRTAGRTWSLFCFIFSCPARGHPVATAGGTKGQLMAWCGIASLFLGMLFLMGSSAVASDAPPAPVFFPVLPFDAPENTSPSLVPLATNAPLKGDHTGITRAVIGIPDETRDAGHTESVLASLAGGLNSTTLILVPQFLLPSDISRYVSFLPDKGKDFAAWPMGAWALGGDSVATPPRKGISSFTVVDLLLMVLSDRRAFPDLHTITIVGYGMGGDFVQRYAAFSLAADAVAGQDIDLRYLVANASSYLYLTAKRPLGERKGFDLPDRIACAAYNTYPYGLEKFPAYAKRGGANAAKLNYGTRFVTYLSAPSPLTPDLSCAAQTQGADAVARSEHFKTYLHSLYGDLASRTHLFVVSHQPVSNDAELFSSPCGVATLFGGEGCLAQDNP